MNPIRIGAVFAFLGVLLGAFGAHFLRGRLDPALSQTFETAVRYQMYHSLALIGLGLTRRGEREPSAALAFAGTAFVVGIVVFSGSLYILAITGTPAWGAVTPVGGLALLAGWIAFAIGARRTAP